MILVFIPYKKLHKVMKKTAIWSQIWDWALVIPFVCCLTRFLQVLNELTYMTAPSLVTRALVGAENNFLSSFNSYFPFSFFCLFIIFPPPFSSIFLKSVFHITSCFSQLNLFCLCPFLAHLRASSSYPWRYRSSRKEIYLWKFLPQVQGFTLMGLWCLFLSKSMLTKCLHVVC